MTDYVVIYERNADGWWAYLPDLPGCTAVGKDREQVEQQRSGRPWPPTSSSCVQLAVEYPHQPRWIAAASLSDGTCVDRFAPIAITR